MIRKLSLISIIVVICCTAQAQNEKGFDRGFTKESNTFVPKGFGSTGLSIAYDTYNAGNGDTGYEFLSVIKDVDGKFSTFKVSPSFSYFFARNTAAGFRIGYSDTNYDVDKASFSVDNDTDMDLSNHYFRSHKYTAAATIRNYIPLFGSKIFALFNEGRLIGGFGQSKSYQITDTGKDGSFTDNYSLSLGLNSGLCTFVTNDFAFEVSLDVLGFEYSTSHQTRNQVYESDFSHFGASYKVKLTTINFSLVYFFNIKKCK
jgi:hypothetical protein